jgi:ABC-type bacteriocin/lantibiotic exporter with double-glycine peptidase domain
VFSFRDLNQLADGIGSKFGRLIYSFSSFTAGYVLGLCYLWKMTLVMLAVLPVVAVSGGVVAKVTWKRRYIFHLIFDKTPQKN